MLATHTFQHTLFDWLKFTWVPPNSYGSHQIMWVPCEFTNQRECVEKCVRMCAVSISRREKIQIFKFKGHFVLKCKTSGGVIAKRHVDQQKNLTEGVN